MKREEIIEKSIFIISEYYRNNLEPFFSSIADDVLWIGPRAGQVLTGKDAIIKTWAAETDPPLFSMGNITAKSVSTSRNSMEVLLEYYVYTHFPNGETDKHHQRLHYSWGTRSVTAGGGRSVSVPMVCMIHISNIASKKAGEGNVYAASASQSLPDAVGAGFSRIFFRTISEKGAGEATLYCNSASILWIESADGGRHSIVHADDASYRAIEPLRFFEDHYSDALIRVHASYLVNPLYVRSLKRFELELTDGTALAVPQKKYTAVRALLEGWHWEKLSDSGSTRH